MKSPKLFPGLALFLAFSAILAGCGGEGSGAPNPLISTIAGTGIVGYSGDGEAATSAQLCHPLGVAVDAAGNIYIADSENHRIRKVDVVTGIITTIAGTGIAGSLGDGEAATAAQLNLPWGVEVDSDGNIFIADYGNHKIRKIDATTGIISTIAGTGTAGFTGDGEAAVGANLQNPWRVAVDTAGNVYITDTYNARIRKVDATTCIITTIAGGGAGGDGEATSAKLLFPTGVEVDSAGNIYIAEFTGHRIRKVNSAGIISTIAGTGETGDGGDGGEAINAQLNNPSDLAIDSAGNIYIADLHNHRLRKVNTTGTIATLAGTGTAGYSGDGGVATAAQLNNPIGIAVGATGVVYIADRYNHVIRKVK